jgi:hypothetical protein
VLDVWPLDEPFVMPLVDVLVSLPAAATVPANERAASATAISRSLI